MRGRNLYGKRTRNTAASAAETQQQERVKETTRLNRINNRTSDSELLRQRDEARKKNDMYHLAAIHQEMASRESLSGRILQGDQEALNAYFADFGGVKNAVAQDTRDKVAEKNAAVAYNNDVGELTKAFKNGKVKIQDQTANSLTSSVLQAGLESNKIDQNILDELSKDGAKSTQIANNLGTAVRRFEDGYESRVNASGSPQEKKALEKQRTAAHQAYFAQTGAFHATVANNKDVQNAVFKKADATTLAAVSKDEKKLADLMPTLLDNAGASKTVNILAKLAEDGAKVKQSTDAIIALENQSGPGLEERRISAESAHQIMGRDHRFGWVARVQGPGRGGGKNKNSGNSGNAGNSANAGGPSPLRRDP
ncbi:MAG TPA: hypothetical protein VN437_04420, partial [Rectinemataceae bacterium]|nr:hypothetical protein [Rectinemataceae bacterium]